MARKLPPSYEEKQEALDRERAREEIARKNELADLHALLGDERARRFIWRILARTGVFAETMNPNSAVSAHSQGKRSIGLYVIAEVQEADPWAWLLMQQDALQRQLDAAALSPELSDPSPTE